MPADMDRREPAHAHMSRTDWIMVGLLLWYIAVAIIVAVLRWAKGD